LRTFLGRLVDRTWPRLKPEQLVRRVLAEEKLGGRGWSDADLPLIDEARALLEGPPQQHGHVIVDEAQDLTPMQLRMIARRTAGAMTILGDIAQASGPVEYHRWEDLLPHLADGRDVSVAELRLAYRVPREVMELALPLLPLIAPDVAAPIAYREGEEPPRIVKVARPELVAAAVHEASVEAAREGRTALIAPAKLLPDLPVPSDASFDELAAPFQTLTPRAAKGLEFDRVVLVEPAAIAAEGAERIEGLRALYVALTRATKTLVIVHAKPLPPELSTSSVPDMSGGLTPDMS
jgi:DNA helicase IV